MSGDSLLLDTNIVILTLGGHAVLAGHVEGKKLLLSVISELEALGDPAGDEAGEAVVRAFVKRCSVVGLEEMVKNETVRLRRSHRLKLPDAIIAATAIASDVPPLIANKGSLRSKNELVVDLYEH